nr:MAG TPA: hypothetical protein [Caudoviricetes sp.]
MVRTISRRAGDWSVVQISALMRFFERPGGFR